ncbi:Psathyrella Velutina lectin At 1.5a resolution [Panaeolus papilionaceus]|nr:Psathyrella Velutina lectin At 1.5a resolution [Panaeolus papilionaceus]
MIIVISQSDPVPTRAPGIADIVGFGPNGVFILRNSLFPKVRHVLSDFGFNAGGWRNESHVRLLADTTGDKSLDIVGFGEDGVIIALNQGNNNFSPGQLVLRDFAIGAGGWYTHKHIRFMADIRNTGRSDIVGFGQDGVVIAENKGNLQFSSPALRLKDFGYNQGWRLDRHLRFLADVTGNGLLDIVGFGETNVFVALNGGNGRFLAPKAVVKELCYSAGGWRVDQHPRFVADLTGSKRCDLIGFGASGVAVALNRGDGTFDDPKFVGSDFGYNTGWRVEKHVRLLADVDGDGLPDIVGFGETGVWVGINNGDGTFQPAKKVVEDRFGYKPWGWTAEKHPRFAVDLTGDGTADLIGFHEGAVWVVYNDGKGNFDPVAVQLINDLSVNQGWSVERSVRFLVNLYA